MTTSPSSFLRGKFLLFALVVALLAAFALAGSSAASASAAGTGSITGTVTAGGVPLSGVSVQLTLPGGSYL